MSNKDESSNRSSGTVGTLKDHLGRFAHVYVLFAVFVFTIVTRFQGYQRLRTDGGGWEFVGNDGWYHFRATMYSVENYPLPLGFDAKTGYPFGTDAGAFGTLYDFVFATISMIVGLGSPSEEVVETVLVVASPILSGITVIVVFFFARYLTGSRLAGVFASMITALIPGTFYSRGVVGFAQHHIAESLLLVLSLYATIKVVQKAEEDLVIFELIADGEYGSLKGWVKKLLPAMGLIFTYYLVWPPALMFFGLVGIAGVIHSLVGFGNKATQSALLTYTVLTGSMVVMVLVNIPSTTIEVAKPSLLHLGVTGVSFVFTFVSWIVTRRASQSNWDIRYLIGSLTATTVVSGVLAALVNPAIFSGIFNQVIRLLGYPFGIGGGSGVQTIGEERSASIIELILTQYGLMFLLAMSGIVILLLKTLQARDKNKPMGQHTLLLVVSLFIMVISLRTVRFNYYLAPLVGILASVALLKLIQFVEIPDGISDLQGYHVVAIILVAVLFAPVLLVPVQGGTVYDDAINDRTQQSYDEWVGPLEWMADNTSEDGIDQYERTTPSYEYGNDSYGVMSWWDYGHWLTVTGERTPVANPFQQNAEEAARYLLAQNPEEAEQVISEMDENASVKYVAIDWQMASPISKYPAMEAWHPEYEQGDSYTAYYTTPPGQRAQLSFIQREQTYYQSMLGRLYVGHGGAIEASNKTINYSTTGGARTIQPATSPVIQHNTTEEARAFTESNTQVSRGGLLNNPPERVEALDQYRLVKSSQGRTFRMSEYRFEIANLLQAGDQNATELTNENPSTVKIFEHVDGAEINGSGAEPNSTVTLEVDVEDPVLQPLQSTEFTYRQRVDTNEDGSFTATVPYSNTGYDAVENPPEVQGSSQYRVVSTNDNVLTEFNVSETSVITETEPIEVEIESQSTE